MFQTNTSPFAGLVKVILALVIIGVLVGLALAGSDLTNFITISAKAQAITMQNEVQAQKDAIDIEVYRKSQNDNLLLQQKQAEQSLLLQAQKAAQEMETARILSYIWTGAGVFVAFCIGIGIVIYMVQVGRSRQIAAQTRVEQADLWKDPIWRKQQILISRHIERIMRVVPTHVTPEPRMAIPIPVETPIPWDDFQQQLVEVEKP